MSGSGRGIGRAIALKLASEGARVVVNDLDAEPAQRDRRRRSRPPAARRWPAPAASPRPTSPSASSAPRSTAYGGLDIIVNNAGYTWDNVIQKMTDEQWDAMLDVHLTAPFRILRAAAALHPRRRARPKPRRAARCSARSSTSRRLAGVDGNAGQANYSAAKAGIIGLTKALAKEWGRYKVNVNCVAFGLIKTRLTEADADGGRDHRHRRAGRSRSASTRTS